MEKSIYELICLAIKTRSSIKLVYDGKTRIVSPHVIGKEGGELQALFYQSAGGSVSGLSSKKSDNWRCLKLNKIKSVELTSDVFQTPNNWSLEDQTCVDIERIICHV